MVAVFVAEPAVSIGGRRHLVLRSLTLAVLLTAGCGGGGSATVTVTTGSSTPSTSTPTSSAPDPAQTFTDYLAEIQTLRTPANGTEGRTYRRIKSIDSFQVTAAWDAAGAQARRTAFTLGIVSSKVARIQAPRGLQAATIAYANMWADDGHVYSDLSWTLLHHQTFVWSTYDDRWTANYRQAGRFRIALLHFAASHQLRVPRWVRQLGT